MKNYIKKIFIGFLILVLATRFLSAQTTLLPQSQKVDSIKIVPPPAHTFFLTAGASYTVTPPEQNIIGAANVYGENDHYETLQFLSVGIQQKSSARTSYFHTFGQYFINKSKHFQYTEANRLVDSTFFYQQIERTYAGSVTHRLSDSLSFSFCGSLAFLSFEDLNAAFDNTSFSTYFSRKEVILRFSTLAISAIYHGKGYTFMPFFSRSDLGEIQIWQIGGEISYAPRTNPNCYATTMIAMKQTPEDPQWLLDGKVDWVWSQKGAARVGKNAWFSADVTMGNLQNFVTPDGATLFNTADRIKKKITFSLLFTPKKHFQMTLQGTILFRTHRYYQFSEYFRIRAIDYNYEQRMALLSLRWNF